MKEIKSIINLYNASISNREKAAIAQVVRLEESSYRREGARMLVFESGIFEGGISGGCLEGDALQRSQIAILKQEPSIVTYDTSKDKEIGVGLGCNGIIDVLISPITEDASAIRLLEKCISDRKEHIIVTITAVSEDMESVVLGQRFYFDTETKQLEHCEQPELKEVLREHIAGVLDKKKSKTCHFTLTTGSVSAFIELIPPQFHLAIYGDNYDVYPMLAMAEVLDWEVSLVGNIQKLKKEALRSVAHIYPKDEEERPTIDERTAIILMAHDYKTDCENLELSIKSPSPYIASLGPKKRFVKMLDTFKEQGIAISMEDQQRIYAPCGLEIGANTPEEIAMSIFSEILGVFSGNTGGMLRLKKGPIHERI